MFKILARALLHQAVTNLKLSDNVYFIYEEWGSVTLDLRSRMVTLYTLLMVFPKFIRKSLRSQSCYLAELHFV
jgi:hypothetical protein